MNSVAPYLNKDFLVFGLHFPTKLNSDLYFFIRSLIVPWSAHANRFASNDYLQRFIELFIESVG